ncbi:MULTISPECIES: HAMP domain-containing sensor histidine kinase [Alteromonadales]|uniref:histidine kinase n=1 Tax=Colwellia chukchiensis TaxID=641665 RepID=A0A1H7KDI3_9GAMM|nr:MULTISPECIES: HAMP domain-containing sensor histidine kinase [Alteromonadales]MAY57957.1 sensor histidine kinase [Pseudoalteromonas sp.]MDN3407022.1 HAMP domain-containing sensor histidine kinase [Pseudoalteromonas sp. APC 3218]MDN3410689.1 HAMP domain-containing sensor histidine kinase [Pseudoalteromonas sp. APC 3894]MDN3418003.1 HAMP domain-containing sensor histidine kinase [Pseudoalteromonas sp. APC 3227]MDN3421711.1 HAMP domain-containing sensor histidine kinase [Pseudoalteromonas sp. |tara:strand:+ start:6635 stop:8053 length:1419 start_codon:yes stop_codon:yes gene_type:complete
MNSIHKKLSRYLSISISLLLFCILLATDISVDTWISDEFDRAMINKVGLLETLVEEDENGIEFDFAGEFMPEFEGKENPEYYQLWYKSEVFERSDTLELFEIKALSRLDVKLHEFIIQDTVLPDGRNGRMLYTKFFPQVDSDIREILGISREEFAKNQQPMELAYALSREELDYIHWFVDIIFIFTSIFSVFIIRIIVKLVVSRSLKPISELSQQLRKISLNSKNPEVSVEFLPQELVPIAEGVNQFIKENHILYIREQRMASDIAHELKTPIAELISLSEVALKFPHEKEISDNLASDVHGISYRLKNIVSSIMLLQKSSSSHELETSKINLTELIGNILARENSEDREIKFHLDVPLLIVETNKFALETVLSNLINNAIFYSPTNTAIEITTSKIDNRNALIKISNICYENYQENELKLFFDPLWQKDESRTSTERFGLGLAIVKSYCEKIGATVSISLVEKKITFTVSL